ncbi:hypothetical protein C0992_003823 [Termitomyces sp. T32_za158]|nr:hypothetical protein C0992_003823 [Termitomyces sp. T32_za158]
MKRGKKLKGITLDLKSTRHQQVTEAYSAKYYQTKIKPLVDEALQEMSEWPRYPLPVVKHQIKKAWEAESEEVRRTIIEEVNSQPKGKDVDTPRVRSPDEYASAIASIPDVIKKISHSLQDQTGWVWTILGGGPDPTYPNGQVRTVSFNFGRNTLDHSFKMSHDDYNGQVLKPFLTFAASCFTPEVCAARALKSNDEKMSLAPLNKADDAQTMMKSVMDVSDYTILDSEDEDDGRLFDVSVIDPQLFLNTSQGQASITAATVSTPTAATAPTTVSTPTSATVSSAVVAIPVQPVQPSSALTTPQTAPTQSPSSTAEDLSLTNDCLSSAPQPDASDSFIFPPMRYDNPPHDLSTQSCLSPYDLIAHSRLTNPESGNELLASLKRHPSVPAAKAPKQKKQKTTKAILVPKNVSNSQSNQESLIITAKRVWKSTGTKEVIPLTVDADGKPLPRTTCKLAPRKKGKGKENAW